MLAACCETVSMPKHWEELAHALSLLRAVEIKWPIAVTGHQADHREESAKRLEVSTLYETALTAQSPHKAQDDRRKLTSSSGVETQQILKKTVFQRARVNRKHMCRDRTFLISRREWFVAQLWHAMAQYVKHDAGLHQVVEVQELTPFSML